MIKGKFAYVAPEMLRGEQIDRRYDIFSLGVVLHELLTGESLFSADTDIDTLRNVMAGNVPPPSTVNPHVPPEIDDVVLRSLAQRPGDRYQTAEEFQEELDRATLVMRQPMNSKKVRTFMAEYFAAELQRERDKVQYFKQFNELDEVEGELLEELEEVDDGAAGGGWESEYDDVPADLRPEQADGLEGYEGEYDDGYEGEYDDVPADLHLEQTGGLEGYESEYDDVPADLHPEQTGGLEGYEGEYDDDYEGEYDDGYEDDDD